MSNTSSSLWEVIYDETEQSHTIFRILPSNAGAALTSGVEFCHCGWMSSSDADYDTAKEVLVIESSLEEVRARYLQLTNDGPLRSDYRAEPITVKGDYRELAKAIGQLHRTSSYETSAVIIAGDLSSQESEHIKSNVSQEVPSLKNKFKAPYAGSEHVSAIGAACYAHNIATYKERNARSWRNWPEHDEL